MFHPGYGESTTSKPRPISATWRATAAPRSPRWGTERSTTTTSHSILGSTEPAIETAGVPSPSPARLTVSSNMVPHTGWASPASSHSAGFVNPTLRPVTGEREARRQATIPATW